jgi:hypothetical protein
MLMNDHVIQCCLSVPHRENLEPDFKPWKQKIMDAGKLLRTADIFGLHEKWMQPTW